jgi:isoquinoline 1-oxidoreductase beta subunit
LNALSVRLAGQSLLAYQRRSPKPPLPDATVTVGAINPIYSIPNTLIDYVEMDLPIQIGFWRSVGWSHNGFIAESSIDEAAVWAGRDPIAFRRDLIHGKARETAVLDAIEKLSGWGRQLPPGHGMGIALTAGFEAVTAQVAHVSVIDGRLRVHKVWCVYDAGMVVDPLNVEAQVESGIVYGLSAALFGEITFKKGAVVQSNFDDFGMLTLANMPDLEVHVMETGDEPGGAGEASVPGIAPAVTNAIFAATGERIRKLPLRSAGLNVA